MLRKLRSLVIALSAWNMSEKPLITHTREDDDAENIERLLEKGYTPNTNSSGHTPLMYAAGNGNTRTVSILLWYGANPIAQDVWGNTALHRAADAWCSHFPIFRKRPYLNEKGGGHDVHAYADYESCIHQLCEKMGRNIDTQNQSGETALIRAVGFPEHVRAILSFSPELNIKNKAGSTALDIARKYHMTQTEKLLLDAGAKG